MTDLLECAGEDDPPICARCGEDYTLYEYDAEPTKYCDACAHALVEAWEPVVRAAIVFELLGPFGDPLSDAVGALPNKDRP